MARLPEGSNFYASIRTAFMPEQVAEVFKLQAWTTRKVSWTDFIAVSDFAEVVIESCNPVLLHGMVADVLVNVSRIVGLLEQANLSGSCECYGEDRRLMLQTNFGNCGTTGQ